MQAIHPVTFVGAGPGDPGLLTIKGRDAIAQAGLVIYAGSLVPVEIVRYAHSGARVVDSAPLTLEQTHALAKEYALAGAKVARVHTGDPSFYGALREQIGLLEADGIPWRVIPGVTAACAAAAAAGISFTCPQVSQTLILTRMAGRTPMPDKESLAALASHHTPMAIYLSGSLAPDLQEELSRILPGSTPVLCAQRLGWPGEKTVWTTLDALARCVEENQMQRQCIFLVLPEHGHAGTRSRLYDAGFGHAFRPAKR